VARTSYFPSTDEGLLSWALNFSSLISATPTSYGLVAGDATAFAVLKTAFANAMAANEPGVRNKMTVSAKNVARDVVKNAARFLVARIQGTPTVSDAQKYELRITVRSEPTPMPAPALAPVATVKGVADRSVRMTLRDAANLTHRRKPVGVTGASVFWCAGAEPSPAGDGWTFGGVTTETTFDLVLNGAPSEAATVWICAMWVGTRGELGPACAPVRVDLLAAQATPVQQLKVAA
jgi:hypothetical protein